MSLFDSVETCHTRVRTYRIAEHRPEEEFWRSQQFDSEEVAEMEELVSSHGTSLLLQELRDGPFIIRSRLKRRETRFSDGSFGVFYSSPEVETANAEVEYWIPGKFEAPLARPRTLHYVRFSCEFTGTTKDLRPSETRCPKLTSEDYRFCQQLGVEANSNGLDGFLTPSARRTEGTNLPVFNRDALSLPVLEARMEFTLDPSTGAVTTRDT